MDPASLAIGAASLIFDVFDSSIKFFKFLSCMVDMPKDCEQFRLRLVIEYNRFLAWGEVVGLMGDGTAVSVAAALRTDAMELCGIMSRISWLLSEFRDLNARHKNELSPQPVDSSAINDTDLGAAVSSLEVAYEKTQGERESLRKTSRVIRWISKNYGYAKVILAHPSRVRWASVDKDAFEALLKDLHDLTERLNQLVGDHRQSRIDDLTAMTYRELVVTQNTVYELKDMIDAITTLIEDGKGSNKTSADADEENNNVFRNLLHLKRLNNVSDDIYKSAISGMAVDIEAEMGHLISVPKYDGLSIWDHYNRTQPPDPGSPPRLARVRGTVTQDGKATEAWIEWRCNDKIRAGSKEDRIARLRVMTLAQMMYMKKPRDMYTPKCIGYIDDVAAHDRYGWIFAMPGGSDSNTTVRSLHSILGQAQYKPTLGQRFALAWKLASTLLHLHTVNWLHKGIHSGNIVFAFDSDSYDASKPKLSGFDYARPENNGATTRSLEPKWDIYRWPSIHGDAPKSATSRKTHDIYSLGLVLLEVAHWKPLAEIMCLRRWPKPTSNDGRIRAWLLKEERYPPFKNDPMLELRDITGDRYWRAVVRCIVAHGDDGLRVEEEPNQSQNVEVGLALQKAFNGLVVTELKKISV